MKNNTMKEFNNLSRILSAQHEEANKKFLSILEKHFKYMIDKNKKINHCLIAMGSVAFYDSISGDPLWSHEEQHLTGFSTLNNFLMEWDKYYKFTGCSLSVKRTETGVFQVLNHW